MAALIELPVDNLIQIFENITITFLYTEMTTYMAIAKSCYPFIYRGAN
jgi:hypothetical protein